MGEIIEFLPVDWVKEQVEENPKPLNELGEFVYMRTYSRWLDGMSRRERWHETVKRSIEYNMSLEYKHVRDQGLQPDMNRMKSEAKKLFDNIYNARQMPSGRTLWLGNGNQKINDDFVLGNFNCAFLNIEEWSDLGELFYLLMVGTGVGFKSTKKMAKNMPKIRTNVEFLHDEYKPVKPEERLENTKVTNLGNGFVKVYIGDSKEGWVQSLDEVFEILTSSEFDDVHSIKFSYNSIRPKGERLKTFGGTASGPEPLQEMFEGIKNVLTNKIDTTLDPIETDDKGYGHVRPIHILDIGNLIGNNVVVGGVRRTAEIFLFDSDDYESMFAKYGINGIWTEEQLAQHNKVGKKLEGLGIKPVWFDDLDIGKSREGINHRRMSNNSIAFTRKPDSDFMDLVFEMMQMEGEPGFVNLEEASRRIADSFGVENPSQEYLDDIMDQIGLNPCVEIILFSKNVCNLTTVNITAFVKEDNTLDLDGLLEAQRLSARIGLRMTLATLELPEWNEVQQRDRLLGTSLTGWKDAIDQLGYTEEQENELRIAMRDASRDEADKYAKNLRVNAPMFTTAIKPEGTLSQVMGGVSSGLHWSHSPYYKRRIRINSNDPLALVARDLGWEIHAEVGTNGFLSEEDLIKEEQLKESNTWVITFPVESGAKRTKDDISIDEQFDNYFGFQENYTDMNTSNTISVKDGDWKQAQKRVEDGWDNFVGVSFLAHDGGTYTLAPYEAYSKEEYEEAKEKMTPFEPDLLYVYEQSETSMELDGMEDPDCVGGVCPIR